MKTKLSITLDGWHAQVLEEVMAKLHKDEESSGRQRIWLVRWAIAAVCAAIVQNDKMPMPLGVELHGEDPRVTKLRTEYTDGPSGIADLDENDHGCRGRWFAE